MEVFKEFRFEAAHSLPFLPDGHKCKRKHGHSYKVTLFVECSEEAIARNGGFAIDYADISDAWQQLHDMLDHRDLDDIVKPSSTCENLAIFIWNTLTTDSWDKLALYGLCAVQVQETPTAGVIYKGQ